MSSLGDFRDIKHRTIFHDLLDSTILPPEDKTVGRLWQEAQLLLAAGTVTTATSISSAFVYLLLDEDRLKILLEELETAMPEITKPKRQAELEQLPYLVSITSGGPVSKDELMLSRAPSSKKLSDWSPEFHIASFDLLQQNRSNWVNGTSRQMYATNYSFLTPTNQL